MNKLDAVLDTSAILCLLEDEPGADVVDFIAIDQSLDLGFKRE